MLLAGLIPSDCAEMNFLRKLRELISLFFNHSIQEAALPYMALQIQDFLKNYLEIGGHLTPKCHNLLHYPRVIKAMGPLLNLACFSFEAVHQPLKKISKSSNNQINMPVTILKKVEAKFCISIINSEEHLQNSSYEETKKVISVEISRLYDLQEPVLHLSKLYYKGLRMQNSNVIQLGIDHNGFPIFVLIKLMVKDIELKIIVEDLEILNFNPDMYAYEVMYTNRFHTVKLESVSIDITYVSHVSNVLSSFFVNWI